MGWFSRNKTAKATSDNAEQHNAQPTYRDLNLPEEFSVANEELAAELPTTHNALAGGIPKWEDPLLELDAEAHIQMRRNLAVKKALRKLAIRVSKLDWTAVGQKSKKKQAKAPQQQPAPMPKSPLAQQMTPDVLLAASDDSNIAPDLEDATDAVDPLDAIKPDLDDPKEAMKPSPDDLAGEGGASTQTRAEAIAEIWDQTPGKYEMFEHFVGSLLDGTRFQQIKTLDPDDPKNRGGKWTVPNLFMGQRHRYNAGGDIEWDGAEQLVQVQSRTSGEVVRQAKELPIKQFAIHRPGPGSNPEGDLDLGVAVYNAVVEPWNRANTSVDLWVRQFAVPAALLGADIKKARPDRVNSILADRSKKMQQAMEGGGKTLALSNEEVVRLLQADPNGLTGMVQYLQYKEALMDDVLTMAALTSSAGVSQANRTGDTSEQKDNEDEAAFAAGVQIAHTINNHILQWIIRKNEDRLPPLQEGEEEVYLWPQDPQPDDDQDTDVDETGAGGEPAPGDAAEPDLSAIDRILGGEEAQDLENTAQVFEAMQARAATKRGMGGNASVALAAVSPLPPVH